MLLAIAFLTLQFPNSGLDPGTGVQRVMRLMTEGRPVRVMIYGQSISVTEWPKLVEADLRKRFPKAAFEFRNMAISGFSANLLKRTAERDTLEFYPDLLILHDYGGEPDYEELVRVLRSTTTAEVLLQSDHLTAVKSGDAQSDRVVAWHDQHATWMHGIAEKYGCGYVDVRAAWYARLAADQKPFTDFVQSDKVHLNAVGDRLMTDLLSAYLVRAPKLDRPDPVREQTPKFENGKIDIEVEGNRIDVQSDAELDVQIDGKAPSEFKELYLPSRTSNALGVWFPALLKVEADKTPKLEKVTLRISNVREDAHRFDFKASGSLTGEDGTGDSYAPFTSTSGRVRIQPLDWATNYAFVVSKQMPPDGFEVTWTYTANFKDTVQGQGWQNVAQGLPNGRHHLTLTARKSPTGAVQVRTFNPPSF